MSALPLPFCSDLSASDRRHRPSLITRARRGDREAFAELVAPYAPTVYQRARRLTGNPADAEDVSQEAFLKAWSRLEQFSGQEDDTADDFRAWVSRIAANTSIDVLRQRRDGKIVSLEERRDANAETLGSGIPARDDNPEERYARRELSRILAAAIVQLPRDLRQACLLRDVLHYSTQEVADRLDISIMAVRLRLFRAHRRLREKLQASLQTRAQRANTALNSSPAQRRAPEIPRKRFLPLNAEPEYVCGD
jgi:RNA polymerase sigma-70 factor, ECF subfamily